MNSKQLKYRISYALRLVIGFVLLWLLLSAIDLEEARRLFYNIRLDWIAAAAGLIAGLRALMSLRWKYVLASQGIDVPFLELLRITFIGTFFGHFMPGGVGIDLVRGYELVRLERRAADVATTLILDRFIGVWSMFAIALLGAIIATRSDGLSGFVAPLIVIQILFVVGWMLAGPLARRWSAPTDPGETLKARIQAKLIAMAHSLTDAGRMRTIFPTVAALALTVQLGRCLMYFCIFRAFSAEIAFLDCIALIPIVSVVTLIPISVAGLGVREGALVVLFGLVGVPEEISVSAGLVSHLLYVLVALPGAFLWLSRKNPRTRTTA
jgi:uncharacterized protein (TIRG00374 family)